MKWTSDFWEWNETVSSLIGPNSFKLNVITNNFGQTFFLKPAGDPGFWEP